MNYTVFLDRDGVINEDSPDYIKTEDEFHFIPQSAEAIALLCSNGFDVIIITNQSVIGRNMVTIKGLNAIFSKLKNGVARAGGVIKDIFFCPHAPGQGCTCRKPEPGLILMAAKKYAIDLSHSCMVGDSAKDIECSKNAGCSRSVLVETGNGRDAAQVLEKKGISPDFTARNLMEAAVWISKNLNHPEKRP